MSAARSRARASYVATRASLRRCADAASVRSCRGRRGTTCADTSSRFEQAFKLDRDRVDRRARGLVPHGRRAARRGEPAAPRHGRRVPPRPRSGHARRVSGVPRRHRARGAALLGRAALQAPRLPAVGPSWDDAMAFCRGSRTSRATRSGLPTEAEWERAAKADRDAIYPWGDGGPEAVPDYERRWLDGSRAGRSLSVAASVGLLRARRERSRVVRRLVRRRVLPGVAADRPARARGRQAPGLARRLVAPRHQGDALRRAIVDSAADALRRLRVPVARARVAVD